MPLCSFGHVEMVVRRPRQVRTRRFLCSLRSGSGVSAKSKHRLHDQTDTGTCLFAYMPLCSFGHVEMVVRRAWDLESKHSLVLDVWNRLGAADQSRSGSRCSRACARAAVCGWCPQAPRWAVLEPGSPSCGLRGSGDPSLSSALRCYCLCFVKAGL